jgi:hypothetical protein
MSKIYSVQPVEIELSYTTLPGTIASVSIRYKNPDKDIGEFTATLDETNKLVKYKSQATESFADFSTKANGKWIFWSYFVCLDTSEFPGEPVEVYIYPEGA